MVEFWRGVFGGVYRQVVVGNLTVYDEIGVGLRLKRFRVLYLDERIREREYVVMQKQLAIYTSQPYRKGELQYDLNGSRFKGFVLPRFEELIEIYFH